MKFDLVRILSLIPAGMTYGLAAANLVISYEVLRPRPFSLKNFIGGGGGFIWLHIVCVVIPFQGFVTWGIIEVLTRLGEAPTWRPSALVILCLIINVGYAVIFRVELARLRLKRVLKEATAQ